MSILYSFETISTAITVGKEQNKRNDPEFFKGVQFANTRVKVSIIMYTIKFEQALDWLIISKIIGYIPVTNNIVIISSDS